MSIATIVILLDVEKRMGPRDKKGLLALIRGGRRVVGLQLQELKMLRGDAIAVRV